MKSKFKHDIAVGVVVTLIVAFIIWLTSLLTDYIGIFLSSIWLSIISSWNSLFLLYEAPGWLFILLIALSLLGLIYLFVIFKPFKPKWSNYKCDQIGSITWRWNWKNNEIINLIPFCPNCEAELVHSCREDYYGDGGVTTLECENCPCNLEELELPAYSDVISQKKREITRRVRTEEYLKSK